MKLPISTRRSNSFRTTSPIDNSGDSVRSPASIFWLITHGICCLISLILGFRFSRLVFFLFFASDSTNNLYSTSSTFRTAADIAETLATQTAMSFSTSLLNFDSPANSTEVQSSSSHVVVGRHGILIRPWPHPNPEEVMKAHRIIERVQKEQRVQYGVKNAKTVIVVTPTYVRTFQALHLTGVMHCLMNVPYDLVWIVVEAGGKTNETASLIAKSGIRTMHIGFKEKMPVSWEDRHKIEARMRMQALRVVREEKLDGIVMFGDDSNMHSMELFDEIQKVKWFGAFSVGILAHFSHSDEEQKKGDENKSPVPVQGPACNSSDHLVGWHTFNSLPYKEQNSSYIGDKGIVLPRKMEWAGFAFNSRLVWEEDEDLPEWFKDLDAVDTDREDVESPLSLLKDSSVVELLGSCGRKVLLWWLRVEARSDSKFPSGWIINPPLEVTVPAKRSPWPDTPPELPSNENVMSIQEKFEKRAETRSPRLRHTSRSKRKHKAKSSVESQVSVKHSEEK